VQRKSRTSFQFQYVPQESKKTGREAYHAGRKLQTGQTSHVSRGLFEVVFLSVFLVFGGLTVGGILVGGLWVLEMRGRRHLMS
jgi:hypothetical protein